MAGRADDAARLRVVIDQVASLTDPAASPGTHGWYAVRGAVKPPAHHGGWAAEPTSVNLTGMTERPMKVTTARVQPIGRLTPPSGPARGRRSRSWTGFRVGEFTDHYVKVLFPLPGVDYPEPFDLGAIRDDLPREQWPRLRTYTVRAWDADAGELTIDFVHHGDEGLAGPWAAARAARRPDPLPRPRRRRTRPSPDADWHLLAGDESALPAIAAALEAAAGRRARPRVVRRGRRPGRSRSCQPRRRGDRLAAPRRPPGRRRPGRGRARPGVPARRGARLRARRGRLVKELRRLLRVERGVPRERLSISGYWRLGADDEGWQAGKREWNRQVEAEESPSSRLTGHRRP